ncbi:MAG: hypothetical protein D6756_09345 [Cyanobacteria bacterium J083]|nr:MAG: hypothetical protein D6756_09345 [Cyanobacteria bacterium J083]
MNASEQAKGLKLASKIARVVTLFQAEFPDAKADLKPWRNDPETRSLIDPDSIDIGFHFPGWSPRFQSNSILVQIRFHKYPLEKATSLIGVECAGFNYQGEAWRLSTVEKWQLVGKYRPEVEVELKIKSFSSQVFQLFR